MPLSIKVGLLVAGAEIVAAQMSPQLMSAEMFFAALSLPFLVAGLIQWWVGSE